VRSSSRKTLADRFRWYWKITNRVEALEVRWFGTSGVGLMRRSPMLVLETKGRRTGRRRRTPVVYWRQDDRIFIGGGAAGMTRVDWVANVRAEPAAVAWVDRRRTPVRVVELEGAEYEAARARALELWPNVPKYEIRSGRKVPYFRLEPLKTD
jgi:deazaflavin-dependent oxidoreductase (nitroreductase family)